MGIELVVVFVVLQRSQPFTDAVLLRKEEGGDWDTIMTVETVLTHMPIDIETFTEASDEELTEVTNAEKVVRFLYQNDDKAFTPSEIAEGAGVKKNSISTVLRRLRERDLVQHKGDYWAIGDEETVQDAFRFHRTMEDLDQRLGTEDIDEWREHAADDGNE